MDNTVAGLTHQVFGIGKRQQDGGMRSQSEGIIEKLRVYHFPEKMTLTTDAQLAVIAFFTSYGRSESISPSAWATWAFSYLTLLFPEFRALAKKENEREYEFVPLSGKYIQAIVDLAAAAEDYDPEHPQDYETAVTQIPTLDKLPELERNSASFPPELAACTTVQSLYGFGALILFLAGKKIQGKNVTTITERRPKNLVDAYNISETAAYILTGDGKMGTQAHANVYQACITYAPMRRAVISEVARFSMGTSLPQRVTYTIVKMMEYAGMQQGTFIHEYLQAMPHTIDYSCIRPSYNAYVMSLRDVAKVPGYLQPFFKIIHGDSTKAFHRNSIFLLAAVATSYKRLVTPSMENFDLGDGAVLAVNLFDAEAAQKGHSTLSSMSVKDAAIEEAE
jgi:hypothetical protein